MGGVTREDQGWGVQGGECGSVPDRRQDRHRNDRGPSPECKRDLDRNNSRRRNAEVSNVRYKVTMLGCAGID